MGIIEIPEGIKPREFFCSFLPDVFKAQTTEVDLSVYQGIEFRLEFNVTGPEGGTFSVLFKDGGNLEVSECKAQDPSISIEVSDKVFMDGLSGRIPEFPIKAILALIDPALIVSLLDPEAARQMLQALGKVKGLMNVEARRGGEKIELAIKFNGADLPSFKIIGNVEELMGLLLGTTDPMQGYMNAKFRIEGDLAYALALQSVLPRRQPS